MFRNDPLRPGYVKLVDLDSLPGRWRKPSTEAKEAPMPAKPTVPSLNRDDETRPSMPPAEKLSGWEAQEMRLAFDDADASLRLLIVVADETLSALHEPADRVGWHGSAHGSLSRRVAEFHSAVSRYATLIDGNYHRHALAAKEAKALADDLAEHPHELRTAVWPTASTWTAIAGLRSRNGSDLLVGPVVICGGQQDASTARAVAAQSWLTEHGRDYPEVAWNAGD